MIPKTEQTILDFEAKLKKLIDQGLPIARAVALAYSAHKIMDVLYEEVSDKAAAELERGAQGLITGELAKRVVEQPWAKDGLTLSRRTASGRKRVLRNVRNALSTAIKRGKNAEDTAKKLFDGYGHGGILPTAELPKYLKELEWVGRNLDIYDKAYREILYRAKRNIELQRKGAMKQAYQDVMKAVERGRKDLLDKAIHTAAQEQTRYFARRIARTELARAYHDGAVARYDADEDVLAYRWRLSSRHPAFDICDFYANADLYGLGKGVYPKGKAPQLPAHPHCMCHLQPVYELDGKEKDNVEKGGEEYLKGLTTIEQRKLLGVNGAKEFLAGRASWQEKIRGAEGRGMKSRLTKELEKEYGAIYRQSGALSGALNDKNDPWQERRDEHAARYYEFLRNIKKDTVVDRWVKSTGMRRKSIEKIYDHLLINEYELTVGKHRFDVSYEMAQSMQRLFLGQGVRSYDILMMKHERLEYELMNRYGYSYDEAHDLTNIKYNYEQARRNYHGKR